MLWLLCLVQKKENMQQEWQLCTHVSVHDDFHQRRVILESAFMILLRPTMKAEAFVAKLDQTFNCTNIECVLITPKILADTQKKNTHVESRLHIASGLK